MRTYKVRLAHQLALGHLSTGCGQCALIVVQLLFEGGDYNIQGLAA